MTPLLLENPQIFKKKPVTHISSITPRDLQARLWVTSSSKMNCFVISFHGIKLSMVG